jgi:hypothetical protein
LDETGQIAGRQGAPVVRFRRLGRRRPHVSSP